MRMLQAEGLLMGHHELQVTASHLNKSSCECYRHVRCNSRTIVQHLGICLAACAFRHLKRTPACRVQCRLQTGGCRGG